MSELCVPCAIINPAPVIAAALAACFCLGCETPGRISTPSRLGGIDSAVDSRDEDSTDSAHDSRRPPGRWHADFAFRNSYPRLNSTRQQLDRRLDLPLRLDAALVFDEPYTPLDRRSDFRLTSWHAGVGRQESTRVIWTYYAGGGWGKDLNHQRFLFETLEVDFEYVYAYTGFMAEYYPWEVPAVPSAATLENCLRASRPFLHAGLESGYVSAEGEGDFKVAGMNVYHDEQKVRDWLFSIAVGMGWAFPLNDRWSIILSGDYRFQFYRPEEYSGWNLTTGIRYRF